MRVIRSDDSEIILSLIRTGVNANLRPFPAAMGRLATRTVGWGRSGQRRRKAKLETLQCSSAGRALQQITAPRNGWALTPRRPAFGWRPVCRKAVSRFLASMVVDIQHFRVVHDLSVDDREHRFEALDPLVRYSSRIQEVVAEDD